MSPSYLATLNSRCFLTWKKFLDRAYMPYDITVTQYYLLTMLSEKDLTPTEIWNLLFCEKYSSDHIVTTLKQQGWIEKLPHPNYKRRILIHLSPKGWDKLQEIHHKVVFPHHFEQELLPQEQEQLRQLLQKQLAYLEALCPE